MTFNEFLTKTLEIEEGLKVEYLSDGDERVAGCQILHREVGLDQTKDDRAESAVERLRAMGVEADADSLDFTQEHAKLHEWMHRMIFEGQMRGIGGVEMLAMMFVLGRRWGMREAAQMFDSFSTDTEPQS